MRCSLAILTLAAAFLGLSATASAQMYFQSYGMPYSSPFPSPCSFSPPAPRAAFDSRIDPTLLRAAHLAESHAHPHSTMRCWAYVKTALLQAGAVRAYPSTSYACQAGSELVGRYGFTNLHIRDPYRAPVGSVLVYGGGGAGHVELRTEHGFASDYRSSWRCRYPLLGVYARVSA